jgi:hypothetical protein
MDVSSPSLVMAPKMLVGIFGTITKIELTLATPPRNTNYDSS